MNKILRIGIIFSLTALTLVCQKKKESGCAEDFVCSYLLLEATRVGSVSISADTRAFNNAGQYTVNVLKSADCSGTALKTTTFYDNRTPNVLSVTYSDLSSGTYTVQTTTATTSLCSGTFSIGAIKSLASCRIATSAITCN